MIKNKTQNTIVSTKKEFFANPWTRARGLMFRAVRAGVGYVFLFDKPTYAAIHMLFVFQPIDVIWLDRDGKVMDMALHVKPFTLHLAPNGYATFMIELAAGTIALSKTQIGDEIEF